MWNKRKNAFQIFIKSRLLVAGEKESEKQMARDSIWNAVKCWRKRYAASLEDKVVLKMDYCYYLLIFLSHETYVLWCQDSRRLRILIKWVPYVSWGNTFCIIVVRFAPGCNAPFPSHTRHTILFNLSLRLWVIRALVFFKIHREPQPFHISGSVSHSPRRPKTG